MLLPCAGRLGEAGLWSMKQRLLPLLLVVFEGKEPLFTLRTLPFGHGALASSWHASVTSSHLMASLLLARLTSVWLKPFWLSCRDFSQTPWQKSALNTLSSTGEDGYEHRKLLLIQQYFTKTKCRMAAVGLLWSCADSSASCVRVEQVVWVFN